MRAASLPYFKMLSEWIFYGQVSDPFFEFHIVEDRGLARETVNKDFNNKFWEERWRNVQRFTPVFVTQCTNEILCTGKYLNVIRDSGKDVCMQGDKELRYTLDGRELAKKVADAYQFASKALLDVFLQDMRLVDRLSSIRRYFFMRSGDFIQNFLDNVAEELDKNASNIQPSKLNNLLQLSLSLSSTDHDPHKEDLTCELRDHTLVEMLEKLHNYILGDGASSREDSSLRMSPASSSENMFMRKSLVGFNPYAQQSSASSRGATTIASLAGHEAFTFDYKVKWPLSLVFTRRALCKYQVIFRLLFSIKLVERELVKCWKRQMSLQRQCRTLKAGLLQNSSQLLRRSMLDFLKNMLQYMTGDVIEPNFQALMQNIRQVGTVDDLLQCHKAFLNKTNQMTFLTNQALIKKLFEILALCRTFSAQEERHLDNCDKTYDIERTNMDPRRLQSSLRQCLTDPTYLKTMGRLSHQWDSGIKQFLNLLNDSKFTLSQVAQRLNFNHFYFPHHDFSGY